jgi:GH35 family endo-1,4-beta-xylanase
MEWNDPYAHPDAKDLPLELQEKISRYETLNTYTTSKLGVGIDFNLYMSDETYRNIINQNFDEITPGNEMKQSSLMKADGTLDFSKADPIINALQQAGLTVYGHTLVWHSQQQAGYLNSLIAPTIIPGTPGSSLIANGDFENGLDGWNIPYYSESVTASADGGAIDGAHSMKVVIGDFGGDKYNMQINSPAFPIINEHKYEISFYIKSEGEGQVGLDFPNDNLTNQYPWTSGNAMTTTSSAWTKVTYNPTTTPDGMVATADNNAMTFRLLLGAVKNVTYYIDAVEVIDLDAEPPAPTYTNLVEHGTFDEYASADNLYPDWNSWGASSSRDLSAEGEGYNGEGKCLIIHSVGGTADYSVQATTNLTGAFIVGHEYHFEAMVKSSVANGSVRVQFQGGSATYLPADAATTVWLKIEHDFTAENANDKLFFDLGLVEADYYIDNVVVYDKASASFSALQSNSSKVLRSGPVIIEKTPEEKKAILEPIFQQYITDVAAHYAGKVAAWDVVNEPMNENGTLREGEENMQSTSAFYWQYYLGRDYAVTAFKAAKAADPDAKLFINDYNLESVSGSKLDGLIEYVKYIESQGAQVDGIGTQLHLNINWTDTNAIKTMFQKLAATGKLIKVSELDIAIANSSNPESPVAPTADQYAQQAELYRFVAAMYNQYIPEAQRYGITVWSVSDNEKEHEYWLKNDAPCLWNADYTRKHAYKGFADGLAGKDVSDDFSGELVY